MVLVDDRAEFILAKQDFASNLAADNVVKNQALDLICNSDKHNYSYLWSWLGLPIIQMPEDIVTLQEIIWQSKPNIIIETGIARGGSAIFYASMLKLLGGGKVIAIDIDLREHNKTAILEHPLSESVNLIEGSSIDLNIINKVKSILTIDSKVMVILDSNHTHSHVLQELQYYSELVTLNQYLVVADTVIEFIPKQEHRPRDWAPGNNPYTAAVEFFKNSSNFVLDEFINNKLLLTANPYGYYKRVK